MKEKNIRICFTLNENINMIFEKYIKGELLDKSKVLENLVIEYLKKNKMI